MSCSCGWVGAANTSANSLHIASHRDLQVAGCMLASAVALLASALAFAWSFVEGVQSLVTKCKGVEIRMGS